MNKQQFAYQIGKGFYNNFDFCALGMNALPIYMLLQSCAHDDKRGALISYGLLNFGALLFAFGFSGRLALRNGGKTVNATPEKYPFEHSERIIIDHPKGLEALLERTSKGSFREWGCFTKSLSDEQNRTIITEIQDFDRCQQEGLIFSRGLSSIHPNISKALEQGYNGFHHYHPTIGARWLSARNYAVSLADRAAGPWNWMNLLSFNMPEGPEVIGYNKQHIYIPTSSHKRELIRTTPRQILAYLNN